jgi:hypothetical protein
MDDLKNCQNSTKYGQLLFCEAVKIDMANSKETSFNNSITSNLSLVTVLFEGLCEAINIAKEFCGEKQDPKPSISLLNKSNTFDGYDFNVDVINDYDFSALQKELFMLFKGY